MFACLFCQRRRSNFRDSQNPSQQYQQQQQTDERKLKSFILLEFDLQAETSRLFQVNRVKSEQATTKPQQETGSLQHQQQQQQQSSRNLTKRSTTIDAIASPNFGEAPIVSGGAGGPTSGNLASSLKSEMQLVGPGMSHAASSDQFNIKPIHRYLSFAVNVLIYVLWDSLFDTS